MEKELTGGGKVHEMFFRHRVFPPYLGGIGFGRGPGFFPGGGSGGGFGSRVGSGGGGGSGIVGSIGQGGGSGIGGSSGGEGGGRFYRDRAADPGAHTTSVSGRGGDATAAAAEAKNDVAGPMP
ncbi:unnamed protein product [Cuscuta campestris]|nr:unnamed protein product [Cuscuta campestris]